MAGESAPSLGAARIRHRVGQFVAVVAAPLHPIDQGEVVACLGNAPGAGALQSLFSRMPRPEQHHGLLVCRRLRVQGFTSPDLLAAALLHDVGKSRRPPRLWERVAVVLLEHYASVIARWISQEPPVYPFSALPWRALRHAFEVRRCHACWGATLAARAGASPRAVMLIRRHHAADTRHDPDLAALHFADEI